MDILQNLMHGFSLMFIPYNLWMAVLGCFLGTVVGILPGLGPVATIAILLPATYNMEVTPAIIMMMAIYCGAKYGGSTTSILMNLPGETSSVVTCFDGYQMARQGRGGAALGISAIGSFIAGTLGTIALIFVTVPLAEICIIFGPAEYFSLIVMGIFSIVYIGGKSIIKSLISGMFGFSLALVGIDVIHGAKRFVYGIPELSEGISFVVIAMGVFGIGEVLVSIEEYMKLKPIKVELKKLWPSWADIIQSKWSIARGTIVGFFIGVLPGAGATLASFISYSLEKAVSKHPERFGKGAIEGVAGPESANNAAAQGSMVPLLALGIPGSSGAAVILAALILHGLRPGPLLFHTNPDFVWALIASMFIGNFVLIIMNLPLVPLFAYSLRIPYSLLYPAILIFCIIGAYSINYNALDVWIMIIFGLLGYFMKKFDIPAAPMVVALVLGRMFEISFMQALTLSDGGFSIFLTRPISAFLLGITAVMTIIALFKILRKKRVVLNGDEN